MGNFELVEQLKLELIRAYEDYVRTVAGLTGTSQDDAREALHSAICKMLAGFRKRPTGNPVVAWRPYIISAAINALRNKQAERKRVILFSELTPEERRKLLAIPDPRPTPAEQAEKNELMALAWEELGKLPPRQREVIARRCNDQTFREIAAAMGVEIGTVKKLNYVGILELRKRLIPTPATSEPRSRRDAA